MITADALKLVPLFAELPDEQRATLAGRAKVRTFRRGELILRAGQPPDGLYIILLGRAKVLIDNEKGDEVILATVGAGDFFGEMGVIDDLPRSATVQTLKHSELIHLTRTEFIRCLSDSPGLAMSIMKALVNRLRHANRQIESLALLDVHSRVTRLLLDLSEDIDGARVIQKAPPKQEIAYMVGASREMVSRVMKSLKNSGYIWESKRRIVFLEKTTTGNSSASAAATRQRQPLGEKGTKEHRSVRLSGDPALTEP